MLCRAALNIMEELREAPVDTFIAQIKKGEPKSEGGFPKDSQTFRLQPSEGCEFLMDRWIKEFGERPTEFKAELPFDTIEQCVRAPFTLFDAAGNLLRLCDGESVLKERHNHREFLTDNNPGSARCCMMGKKPYDKSDCGANLDGELIISIPKLHANGLVRLKTGAWHDIRGIITELDSIARSMRATGLTNSSLKGVPILVSRYAKQASRRRRQKQNGKLVVTDERVQRTEHWIGIQVDPDFFMKVSFLKETNKELSLLKAVQERKRELRQFGFDVEAIESSLEMRALPLGVSDNDSTYVEADEVISDDSGVIEAEYVDEKADETADVEPTPEPTPKAQAKAKPKSQPNKQKPAEVPVASQPEEDGPPIDQMEVPNIQSEAKQPEATLAQNPLQSHKAILKLKEWLPKAETEEKLQKLVTMVMEKANYYPLLITLYDQFDVNLIVCNMFKERLAQLNFKGELLIGLPGITQSTLATHFPDQYKESGKAETETASTEDEPDIEFDL